MFKKHVKPLLSLTLLITIAGVIAPTTIVATDDDTSSPTTPATDRISVQTELLAEYRAMNWTTAEALANQLVELAEQDAGPNREYLATALYYQAAVQQQRGKWRESLATAERASDLLQKNPPTTSKRQIDLYIIASNASLELGDTFEAKKSLLKAIGVNRDYEPVDWLREGELYDGLIELAKLSDDPIKDGNYAARRALKARENHFGEESIDLLAGLNKLATWNRTASQYNEERKVRKRAIELIEADGGENDMRLADQLRGIAETYIIRKKSPRKAEAALQRAIELDFSNTLQSTLSRVQVLIAFGDYNTIYGDPVGDPVYYEQAWQFMADHADIGKADANRTFTRPVRLYYAQPNAPANTGKGTDYFTEGFVLTQFTVNSNGTLDDIEVIDSRPLQMKELLFIKAYRKARFRPRVVDGKAVATSEVQHRDIYSYTDR